MGKRMELDNISGTGAVHGVGDISLSSWLTGWLHSCFLSPLLDHFDGLEGLCCGVVL